MDEVTKLKSLCETMLNTFADVQLISDLNTVSNCNRKNFKKAALRVRKQTLAMERLFMEYRKQSVLVGKMMTQPR